MKYKYSRKQLVKRYSSLAPLLMLKELLATKATFATTFPEMNKIVKDFVKKDWLEERIKKQYGKSWFDIPTPKKIEPLDIYSSKHPEIVGKLNEIIDYLTK